MIDVEEYLHKFSELSVTGHAMSRPVSFTTLECLNRYKFNVTTKEDTLQELIRYRDEINEVMTTLADNYSTQSAHTYLNHLVTLFS